eukprot:1315460-Amorphochlora_amoeboformis.AAC.3
MLPESECLKGREKPIPGAPDKGAKHYVFKTPLYPPFAKGSEMISLGMGCFWCSESLFWDTKENLMYRLHQITNSLTLPVTRIVYDPKVCSLSTILKIFFESHNPTQHMGQGNDRGTQYRSGLYYYNKDQKPVIEAQLTAYQKALKEQGHGEIATEVTNPARACM